MLTVLNLKQKNMLSKKTSKLFFGKYVYKIALRLSVASKFRGNNLKNIRQNLENLKEQFANNKMNRMQLGNWNKSSVSVEDVFIGMSVADTLETLSSYTLRVEGTTLGLYSNDDDFFHKVLSIPGVYVEETSEPADLKTKEFLLSTPKAIIRKEYTHKYKVTIASLWESAEGFKAWAVKLPKIKTTSNKYQYGGHFYVADEKTLSLCHIFLADKIRKVEQLVTTTEI
jgi:hypothetical protein